MSKEVADTKVSEPGAPALDTSGSATSADCSAPEKCDQSSGALAAAAAALPVAVAVSKATLVQAPSLPCVCAVPFVGKDS